jgi:hypothetical protein
MLSPATKLAKFVKWNIEMPSYPCSLTLEDYHTMAYQQCERVEQHEVCATFCISNKECCR